MLIYDGLANSSPLLAGGLRVSDDLTGPPDTGIIMAYNSGYTPYEQTIKQSEAKAWLFLALFVE
jgi:hypothetical protein